MFIPLPAVIFLCSVILLLIALALLYIFLRKYECCKMEGKSDVGEEEGEEEEENLINRTDETSKGEELNTTGGTVGGNTEDVGAALAYPVTPGSTVGEQAVEQVLDAGEPPEVISEVPAPGNTSATDQADKAPPRVEVKEIEQNPEADVPLEDFIFEDVVPQVDFIESDETEPLAIAGKVLVQFTYMPAANKINLTLIRIGDMPPVERGGSETVQAHLCVLPMRKQRFRTKAVPVSKGVFNETFQFIHMTKDIVETCAIRLRIYGTQRFSKRLIGEVKMPLSKLDLTSPLADEQIWKNLSPKGLVAYWYGIDEEDEPDLDDW